MMETIHLIGTEDIRRAAAGEYGSSMVEPWVGNSKGTSHPGDAGSIPARESSAAAPPPREGLPPCIRRLAIIGDSQACWHDMTKCPKPVPTTYRYVISAGQRGPVRVEDDCTNGAVRMVWPPFGPLEATDDSAEAEAAWERAERWVRTGKLDEG